MSTPLLPKDPGGNDPAWVAARRISCLASMGRGITCPEAHHYIVTEQAQQRAQDAAEIARLNLIIKEQNVTAQSLLKDNKWLRSRVRSMEP